MDPLTLTALLKQATTLAESGDRPAARAALLSLSQQTPDDPRIWGWLSRVATNPDEERGYLEAMLRCVPDQPWALAQLARLELHPAPVVVCESFTGATERLVMPTIVQVADTPFPTADPWAGDASDSYRCPYCAAADPGEQRCRVCGKSILTVQENRRLSRAQEAVSMLLVFRTTMLAFQILTSNLLLRNPWSLFLIALMLMLLSMSYGISQRWRWTWWTTICLLVLDAGGPLTLFLYRRGALVGPIWLVVTLLFDLLMINVLLKLSDERGKATHRLALPPDHAMPKNALEALNAGVAYSHQGQWYLAARMWQRAVAWHHHELQYRRALGLAYVHLNEWQAAAGELEAAEQIAPDDPQTQALLQLLAEQQVRHAVPHLPVSSGPSQRRLT